MEEVNLFMVEHSTTSDNKHNNFSKMFEVKPVTTPVLFGETPIWDSRRDHLVFLDCFSRSVNIFDPLTKELEGKEVKLGDEEFLYVCPVIPYNSSPYKFIVGLSSSKIVEFEWEQGKISKVLYDGKQNEPRLGFMEDGKCDAKGRFWLGTAVMDGSNMNSLKFLEGKGQGHKFTKDVSGTGSLKGATEVGGGFDLPNGLGFNKEGTKLFWNDLTKRVVNVFDFDLENGKLDNRKTLIDFENYPELNGSLPDGLCVDLNGDPWVACWKGGSVIKIDGCTGKLAETIKIPATNTTSMCFGGPSFQSMFVTTTSLELDKSPVSPAEEGAGKIFEITNPRDNSFKGFQEHFFDS